MNCVVIFIDKVSSASIQSLISEYESRIKFYCGLDLITINVPKNVRYKSIEEQKAEEQKLILKHIKENDTVILLDEKGKEMRSAEWSQWLEKQVRGSRRLVFVMGGPYGLADDLKEKYFKLSLSKMTFSHEMVRIIFLEQLYRAFTIMKGQKYHHEG
ncbi:MAG: 23S rRNA (pseudouridine(1915)-N(3))-methyltransferase RlmH [Bacteroidia bacterium]